MNSWAVLLLVYLFGFVYTAGILTPELCRFASGNLIAHMPRHVFWLIVGMSLLGWPFYLWRFFNGITDPVMDQLIDTPIKPMRPDPTFPDPKTEPLNLKNCTACDGTGHMYGFPYIEQCSTCSGTGMVFSKRESDS